MFTKRNKTKDWEISQNFGYLQREPSRDVILQSPEALANPHPARRLNNGGQHSKFRAKLKIPSPSVAGEVPCLNMQRAMLSAPNTRCRNARYCSWGANCVTTSRKLPPFLYRTCGLLRLTDLKAPRGYRWDRLGARRQEKAFSDKIDALQI